MAAGRSTMTQTSSPGHHQPLTGSDKRESRRQADVDGKWQDGGMAEIVAAVQGLYEELLTAWNNHDAHRYAALFAEDGSLIGFDGSHVDASDVEAHLARIFADHPTAPYVWKVSEVRPLGGDIVLLRARVGMVPPGKAEVNPAANAVQSLVAVRQDGTWRIALFQNTPAQYHGRPDLADEHTAEMRDAMVATAQRS
jgi:uncharacterized protein (TIGR02246 family)